MESMVNYRSLCFGVFGWGNTDIEVFFLNIVSLHDIEKYQMLYDIFDYPRPVNITGEWFSTTPG